MQGFVVAVCDCAHHLFQKARESIGGLECHDAFGIADAPAPFYPVIGGWTEDALYYHRPRTRHNEQAILIFALEAEMAGKNAAIREPRLHRKAHVDAGLGMPAAGQCGDMRGRTAAEDPHQAGSIRAHIQQAAAAKLLVIAKIGDRQGRNDELRIDVRERAVFGDKSSQRFEMRVIAKHGGFGEQYGRRAALPSRRVRSPPA